MSTRAADLTVTSPNGGEIWSGVHPVTWRGGSSDYKVDVSSNNGGSFTTVATGVGGLSANWDTRAFPDGTNYVVRVTGGAGATDASDAVFTVDNTPPVTTATVTGAQCNGWYSEAPLVTLSATDNLAGVRNTYWRADGGAATAYAGPFRLQGDGARAFEAWSDDRADKPNVETPSGATTVQVDTLDPFTNLSAGLPNHLSDRWYVNSSTPLSFSVAEDGSGVTATSFRVDGGAWLTWDGQPFTLTGPDREVVIDYFSEDDACHTEATRSTTLFLDNTRPDIELTEPNSGSVYRDGDEALAALGLLIELLEAIVGPVPDVQVPEGPVTPEQLCDIARILAQGFRDEGYPDELADLVLLLLCPRPDVGGPVVVTGDVTVRADATDPVVNGGASGLNRVEFLVNGVVRATDTEAPFEWVWNTSEDGGGTHALTVVAFDNLGQDASDGREVVVVDEPQPDVDVDVCGLVDALPVADYIKVLVRYVLVDLLGIGCVPALPLPAVGAP